jgi:aldehyde dehydrogenase
MSAAGRAEVLGAVADAIDANKEMLAVAESWENGKPVRETLAADIPLVIDPAHRTIRQGNPLDTETQLGAQVSAAQLNKIESYVQILLDEGAQLLIGGERTRVGGEFVDGYYFQPTVLQGHNKMRVFQEEIFGPVLAVTTFTDETDALAIANDSLYGLGAGVWTRDGNRAYRMGRGIKAGRVWTNCYHQYPAGAAFGGYKISGIGRENHQMMLDHYSQTKNLLVSYSSKPLGLF